MADKTKTVPTTGPLVKHLTMEVKRHLLNNGVEPSVINDEVIRAALKSFNQSQK